MRAGPPGPAGPSPRAKMLRLIRKRPNPLNIQSNDAFNRWQRGKSTEYSIKRLISSFWERGKGIRYIYLLIALTILESRTLSSYSMHCKFRILVALQGQNLMKKRNLRIQGRMQIFKKMSQKVVNRILTVPQHSTRRELSGTTLKMF